VTLFVTGTGDGILLLLLLLGLGDNIGRNPAHMYAAFREKNVTVAIKTAY
jgi:hypothetical protein